MLASCSRFSVMCRKSPRQGFFCMFSSVTLTVTYVGVATRYESQVGYIKKKKKGRVPEKKTKKYHTYKKILKEI
jgi:hypothetical protein